MNVNKEDVTTIGFCFFVFLREKAMKEGSEENKKQKQNKNEIVNKKEVITAKKSGTNGMEPLRSLLRSGCDWTTPTSFPPILQSTSNASGGGGGAGADGTDGADGGRAMLMTVEAWSAPNDGRGVGEDCEAMRPTESSPPADGEVCFDWRPLCWPLR